MTKDPKEAQEGTLEEAGGSLDDHIGRVRMAWEKQHREDDVYSFVNDVFADYVIVRVGADKVRYYRVGYSVTDESVTFDPRDDWQEVELSYLPVSDAAVSESAHPLRGYIEEAANGRGHEAVIIAEGESPNGRIYTKEALESGPPVFSEALVFADHPTMSEEHERPERSVRDLVGKLGEAYVGKDKHGRTALRAPVILSESADWLQTLVKEGIAGDLSIRATGRGKKNKQGVLVVESFTQNPLTSVDFVTVGAMGGYAELAESARPVPDTEAEDEDEVSEAMTVWLKENAMEPKDIQKLQETVATLKAENAQLFHEARLREGAGILRDALPQDSLPKLVLERIAQQAQPLLEAYATQGSTQTGDDLKKGLGDLVEAEKEYVAKLMPNGVVTGLQETTAAQSEEAADKALAEAFDGLVPEETKQVAVRGRDG